MYSIKIVNEGKYTAYITADEIYAIQEKINSEKQCVPADGTTAEYVASACKDMDFIVEIVHTDGTSINSSIQLEDEKSMAIEPNDYIELIIDITYWSSSTALRADGDFEVVFPDIKLNFSTVNPEA